MDALANRRDTNGPFNGLTDAPRLPSPDHEDKYSRWRSRFQQAAHANFGFYLLVAEIARETCCTVEDVLKWPFFKFCNEYTLRLWLLK